MMRGGGGQCGDIQMAHNCYIDNWARQSVFYVHLLPVQTFISKHLCFHLDGVVWLRWPKRSHICAQGTWPTRHKLWLCLDRDTKSWTKEFCFEKEQRAGAIFPSTAFLFHHLHKHPCHLHQKIPRFDHILGIFESRTTNIEHKCHLEHRTVNRNIKSFWHEGANYPSNSVVLPWMFNVFFVKTWWSQIESLCHSEL